MEILQLILPSLFIILLPNIEAKGRTGMHVIKLH